MGKEVRGLPEDPPLSDAGADRIGRYLARQRQLRGISLAELCERTKIPLRSLERLESGAFDSAPDGFARGFVRTVADALGLDADEAVMRLQHEPPEDELGTRVSVGSVPRVAALLILAGLLVGALLGLWSLGSALLAGREKQEVTLQYRPDAVRDLADEPDPVPAVAADAGPEAAGEAGPLRPLDSPGDVRPD